MFSTVEYAVEDKNDAILIEININKFEYIEHTSIMEILNVNTLSAAMNIFMAAHTQIHSFSILDLVS